MFDKKLKEYKERQADIMTEIKMHDWADEKYYITVNKVFSLTQRAFEIFESSEIQEKRQLLNFLLQNLELKGKKLLYKLKTPFDTVLLFDSHTRWLPLLDRFRTVNWASIEQNMEFSNILSLGSYIHCYPK